MSKIVLNAVADLTSTTTAQTTINNNSNTIQTAFDNTLSRDGTSPNQMSAPLDMNSNHIINLPAPTSNFDAVRFTDVTSLGTGGTITVNPLPTGGTTGQVLSKNSNTNFDAGWSAVTTGVNVTAGKTLSATNTLTLSGTDGTTQTFPSISDTVAGVNATQTLSNKIVNTASGNTLAINGVPLTSTTGSGNSVVLANVPTIASPVITGSFAAPNLVVNSNLAQSPAVTFKGNPTSSTANATDFTINSLTTLGSPDATNDFVPIWDHTAGTIKKANPTAISGAAVAGVSSLGGLTGVLTLGPGITNSGNTILANTLYHRNYLAGLTLSGGGSQSLVIQAGLAASDDNSTFMSQGANYTKSIGTAWAVGGVGAGSLDTGAIANSTWYHVYMIQRLDTAVVDYLTSTSANSPTMPANYTVKRRIGSFKTDGSANITAFTQIGDTFLWTVGVRDQNTTAVTTTPSNLTLASIPLGIQVEAIFNGFVFNSGGSTSQAMLYPIFVTDQTVAYGSFACLIDATAGLGAGSQFRVFSNTAQQIRARSNGGNCKMDIYTIGWVDTRGKLT